MLNDCSINQIIYNCVILCLIVLFDQLRKHRAERGSPAFRRGNRSGGTREILSITSLAAAVLQSLLRKPSWKQSCKSRILHASAIFRTKCRQTSHSFRQGNLKNGDVEQEWNAWISSNPVDSGDNSTRARPVWWCQLVPTIPTLAASRQVSIRIWIPHLYSYYSSVSGFIYLFKNYCAKILVSLNSYYLYILIFIYLY